MAGEVDALAQRFDADRLRRDASPRAPATRRRGRAAAGPRPRCRRRAAPSVRAWRSSMMRRLHHPQRSAPRGQESRRLRSSRCVGSAKSSACAAVQACSQRSRVPALRAPPMRLEVRQRPRVASPQVVEGAAPSGCGEPAVACAAAFGLVRPAALRRRGACGEAGDRPAGPVAGVSERQRSARCARASASRPARMARRPRSSSASSAALTPACARAFVRLDGEHGQVQLQRARAGTAAPLQLAARQRVRRPGASVAGDCRGFDRRHPRLPFRRGPLRSRRRTAPACGAWGVGRAPRAGSGARGRAAARRPPRHDQQRRCRSAGVAGEPWHRRPWARCGRGRIRLRLTCPLLAIKPK